MDCVSSNHLLGASEHNPKSVCILFKKFPKKFFFIVPGLQVVEGGMTGPGFADPLSPCESLSICTCGSKKSLKVSRQKKMLSARDTAHMLL